MSEDFCVLLLLSLVSATAVCLYPRTNVLNILRSPGKSRKKHKSSLPSFSKSLHAWKCYFWIIWGITVTAFRRINKHYSYSFLVLLTECRNKKEFPLGMFKNFVAIAVTEFNSGVKTLTRSSLKGVLKQGSFRCKRGISQAAFHLSGIGPLQEKIAPPKKANLSFESPSSKRLLDRTGSVFALPINGFWLAVQIFDVLYFFLFWSPSLAADNHGAWVGVINCLAARDLVWNFPLFL